MDQIKSNYIKMSLKLIEFGPKLKKKKRKPNKNL